MAEYIYTVDDFSLSSTIVYGDFGSEVTKLNGGSTTKVFGTSDIVLAAGEFVKRAILSATFSWTGSRNYNETIKANGLNFSTGTRKLDVSDFVEGTDWTIEFYFCLAYKALGDSALTAESSSVTKSLSFRNVTLTITTGTGSAFDGEVGSLPEGSKILIDEPDGTQGTYSIVHHGYGDATLCLLWRDNILPTAVAFNQNADTFLADNYGKLDEYLNQTFFDALPVTTKPYIQPAIYPTLDKRLYGTVLDIERYVCTPSVRELKETSGGEEWHGMSLDYLDTVNCGEIYWTRSVYTGSSGNAYYINASGSAYYFSRDYARGVRPCFCVLETQMVTPGNADGTFYVLTSAVDAPANVYLNGATTDLSGQQRDASAMLSWDAVASSLVTGYEVWSCDTTDGEYMFVSAVTAADDGTIPTELAVRTGSKGFETLFFKVKSVTTPDTDYLDSDLSADTRLLATKRTNVHYFDGTRWLLAMPNHYSGSWKQTEGMKYYDGRQWIVPET